MSFIWGLIESHRLFRVTSPIWSYLTVSKGNLQYRRVGTSYLYDSLRRQGKNESIHSIKVWLLDWQITELMEFLTANQKQRFLSRFAEHELVKQRTDIRNSSDSGIFRLRMDSREESLSKRRFPTCPILQTDLITQSQLISFLSTSPLTPDSTLIQQLIQLENSSYSMHN